MERDIRFNSIYEAQLKTAWTKFIHGEEYDFSHVRPIIFDSWKRSRDYHVNPVQPEHRGLDQREVKSLLAQNISLLRAARPHLMKIYSLLERTGYYIYLCDRNGYILDLLYNDALLSERDPSLVVGADRSERNVGTNAIGTALAVGMPIQIWGEEHYIQGHKPYTCTGAPIHDPNGRIIGCLSFTGTKDSVQEHTLSTIVATVGNIEMELARQSAFHPVQRQSASYHLSDIVGESPSILEAKRLAQQVARTTAPVLIFGESGTGKEVFAQSIHNAGAQSCGPFIAVNCGAIPPNLIESELFGYASGAFTGASKGGKIGKLEAASGGTLFLDEIESMPLTVQVALLRALSEQAVTPIGALEEVPINCRVISATKKDLLAESDAGRFREDLYFRLNVVQLKLPPLRERPSDIRLLAVTYLKKFAVQFGLTNIHADESFFQALEAYTWRGNVRELQNVLESVIALAERERTLTAEDLPIKIRISPQTQRANEGRAPLLSAGDIPNHAGKNLKEIEFQVIQTELSRVNGNISKAARNLGIARSTLYLRMKKYNIAL